MSVSVPEAIVDSQTLAICCYYNPFKFKTRLANYRIFREKLALPLLTLELGYDSHFDLLDHDADILIQRTGRDIIWQKERMWNEAMAIAPIHYTKLVFFDTDMVVLDPAWPEQISRLLDRYPLVQGFDRLYDAVSESSGLEQTVFSAPSLASVVGSGKEDYYSRMRHRPSGRSVAVMGGIWAARREFIAGHGFYDAGIVGSGDRATACAAIGRQKLVMEDWRANEHQREHYFKWAREFHADINGQVGCARTNAIHLWHGNLKQRGRHTRFMSLRDHDFNPARDIVVDDQGAWSWNSDKPALHECVSRHLTGKQEDGGQLDRLAAG